MTRNEFLKNYWKYYKMIERNVIEIERYVKFIPSNFKTCSDEIIKYLQIICSEFEIICKLICNISGKKRIDFYLSYFMENIKDFESIKVKLYDIELKPFQIIMIGKEKQTKNLAWWKSYNNIKHNRFNNYTDGNLENLLNAIAALYYLEMYYIKYLGKINIDFEFPDEDSKFFNIVGWDNSYFKVREKLEENIEELSEYTIPIKYIVGNDSLTIYCDNELLILNENYEEIGENGKVSNKVRFGWDVEKGSILYYIYK